MEQQNINNLSFGGLELENLAKNNRSAGKSFQILL
jgi:hypothetical protein